MTAYGLCLGGAYPLPAVVDRGMSDTAKLVRELLVEASDVSASIVLGASRDEALESLLDAYAEASEDNWDGEASAAADPSSFEYANSFLAMLPSATLPPEGSVDPDGEMSLEWYRGPRSVFSISFGRDGTLTYAGLLGASVSHGSKPFSDSIPQIIATHLDHFRTTDPAPGRAA